MSMGAELERYLMLGHEALRLQFGIWRQYRVDYTTGVVTVLLEQTLTLTLLTVVFSAADRIAGWTIEEVWILYAFTRISAGIADTFGEGLWWVGHHARDGTLVLYALRPLPVLFQLTTEKLHFERLAGSIVGVALLLHGAAGAGVTWTPWKLCLSVYFAAIGSAIYLALMVLGAALTVRFLGGLDALGALWPLGEFAKYPTSIFGRGLSLLLLTALPLGVIGYWPAALLLERADLALGLWAVPAAFLSAAAFCLACGLVWSSTLRRYEPTAS